MRVLVIRLKVKLSIFLFSEREGKHNSFSMVDLPGKTPVYILSTEFVMCARHAEKKFHYMRGKWEKDKEVFRRGDWYIEKVFLLSFFVPKDFVLSGIHHIRFINGF